MSQDRLQIVILGLSITSSWGNGHATTYRALVRGLTSLGHDVLFLERETPWYSAHRDMAKPPYGRLALYRSLEDLKDRFRTHVQSADLVIVGSYVPDGIAVGTWVLKTAKNATAFYDIDTPVTLAALQRGDCQYLAARQIPLYDVYFSFTGGPTLRHLERSYGSPMARVLYCSVDQDHYYPERFKPRWDLGYLGTYSADRQPGLEKLLIEPAKQWKRGRFAVVGALFPEDIEWPKNVHRNDHLPPKEHRGFYNRQRFTLNITRADMIGAGYSPSVRLFEAAACGVPVISDYWSGLEDLFAIGSEILISRSTAETLRYLTGVPEEKRIAIGRKARAVVLRQHTYQHRADELAAAAYEALDDLAAARGAKTRGVTSRSGVSSASRIPRNGKRPAEDLYSEGVARTTPA